MNPVFVQRLRQAMDDPDAMACRIVYRCESGRVTERVVSPIRFEGPRVLALCLGSEEPRGFRLSAIEEVQLVRAESVLCSEEAVTLLEVRWHGKRS